MYMCVCGIDFAYLLPFSCWISALLLQCGFFLLLFQLENKRLNSLDTKDSKHGMFIYL
jgi:hypothetical protein